MGKIVEIIGVHGRAGGQGVFLRVIVPAVRRPEALGHLDGPSVVAEIVGVARDRVEHQGEGRTHQGAVLAHHEAEAAAVEQLQVAGVVAVHHSQRRIAEDLDLLGEIHARIEDGSQQSLGIGVLAAAFDALAGQDLHDVAQIHHRHLMGKGLDQTQVVADEADGDALFPLQTGEQLDDGLLHRYVQSGGGLVHDDDLRLQGQGPGDGYPLTLAAGHVVGIAAGKFAGQLHHLQQAAGGGVLFRGFYAFVVQQGLAHDVPDLHLGIEGSGGVLEHHLDVLPVLPQLLSLQLGDVLAPVATQRT